MYNIPLGNDRLTPRLTHCFVAGCKAVCTSYGSRPEAVVGEKLTLHCYLDSYCPTYKWTLITEDNNKIPQNETGNKLVVSTNVSSISEVYRR